MASNLLLRLYPPLRAPFVPLSTIPDSQKTPRLSPSLSQRTHLPLSLRESSNRASSTRSLSPSQELSPTSLTPPSTREEAVLQAKTSLSAALQKPLNNPLPLPTRKLRKQRQPRFRAEIPLVDDSPGSLTQLAFDVFSDMPVTKKGSKPPAILILWPNRSLLDSACQAFVSAASPLPNPVVNSDLSSVAPGTLSSADLAVFLAPEASQLEQVKAVTEALNPKPVVLFNPKWAFEEEDEFGGSLKSFAGSFDVVYSFMGLEVRGILSKRKGVVFRCVRDGLVSGGEGWVVMVEGDEEGRKGELRVVSRFKRRPSIGEVESLLYNLMAANSPVTKSVKFLRDLASNVTGKKVK